VRERLTEVGERFRRLPRSAVYPETLTKLERALETCRKDRRVEPTVLAVKRSLNALRDGLVLLRRMENDLSDAAVGVLAQAENVRDYYFPALAALGSSEEARQAHAAIQAHLGTERAWEDTAELLPRVELVKNEYRARRRALLDAHASEVELAVERLKRRGGLERLDPDQRHRVLRHLREGTAADTDENAIEPRLEALESLLAARREAAENKALAQLDVFLEGLGETPVVEVPLELSGREVASEAELERLIEALRRRVLHELGAHHRVRLK
jgi:hypothetical protein